MKMLEHEAIVADGPGRTWSLRREWSRAFAVMLVLLLVAGAASIVGVRGVVDHVQGTARQLHRESVTVAALRTELVDHEQVAHQLLSDKKVDRAAFVRDQDRISRLFDEAAKVFAPSDSMRASIVQAHKSWQKGLASFGLWGDQVQTLHGDHAVDRTP